MGNSTEKLPPKNWDPNCPWGCDHGLAETFFQYSNTVDGPINPDNTNGMYNGIFIGGCTRHSEAKPGCEAWKKKNSDCKVGIGMCGPFGSDKQRCSVFYHELIHSGGLGPVIIIILGAIKINLKIQIMIGYLLCNVVCVRQ